MLITNMSHNSRGREKTQIALIKCVRGGQGTQKTRKKLPGNWMVDLEGEGRGPELIFGATGATGGRVKFLSVG